MKCQAEAEILVGYSLLKLIFPFDASCCLRRIKSQLPGGIKKKVFLFQLKTRRRLREIGFPFSVKILAFILKARLIKQFQLEGKNLIQSHSSISVISFFSFLCCNFQPIFDQVFFSAGSPADQKSFWAGEEKSDICADADVDVDVDDDVGDHEYVD